MGGRAVKPPPEARWHAGADGEGHAFLVGKANVRALCKVPRHDERFDHPIERKCSDCLADLNRLTIAALESESESRFAWGDR